MVALGAARFPHGSHIYFDDFPIEIPMELSPAPSWSGTSTLGQNTSASPRSDAPGLAWRVIILGLKKRHHVKRMDRAKKT